MIRVRRDPDSPVEELDLPEFERRARSGDIAPQHEVCFPAVTGTEFVAARELELFRGLYTAGNITFSRYFNLRRVPYITGTLMVALVGVYIFWQGGQSATTTEELLRQGAKSPILMVELGHWWRLITANFLHVSVWHLAVNVVFLLNLGGPSEAIFRRLDYVLILVASALGTTLLSAAANPVVSCGASGIVFGVWGAAAVFGVRHREILPERYRKYFVFSVIPYSVFALYLGFARPNVDNWGHLGGLVAGSLVAFFLPARLLHPRDTHAPMKIATLAVVVLLMAFGSFIPTGAGELTTQAYASNHGFHAPVPTAWNSLHRQGGDTYEAFAFKNGVGVIVVIETERTNETLDPARVAHDFIEDDLSVQLEYALEDDTNPVRGLRVQSPESTSVAGLNGAWVRTEFAYKRSIMRQDFLILARGHYRYVFSLRAPSWLAPYYRDDFERMVEGIELSPPKDAS